MTNPDNDLVEEISRLRSEREQMRGALEFYANKENYNEDGVPGTGCPESWDYDEGQVARAALSPKQDVDAGSLSTSPAALRAQEEK